MAAIAYGMHYSAARKRGWSFAFAFTQDYEHDGDLEHYLVGALNDCNAEIVGIDSWLPGHHDCAILTIGVRDADTERFLREIEAHPHGHDRWTEYHANEGDAYAR